MQGCLCIVLPEYNSNCQKYSLTQLLKIKDLILCRCTESFLAVCGGFWRQENMGAALRGAHPSWVQLGGAPGATQSRPWSAIWENQYATENPEYWSLPCLPEPWLQTAQKAATCSNSYKLNDAERNSETKPPAPCSQGWTLWPVTWSKWWHPFLVYF